MRFSEDAEAVLPDALRPALSEACLGIRQPQSRMRDVERPLQSLAKQMPAVEQLRTIPGIGLLTLHCPRCPLWGRRPTLPLALCARGG